MMRSSIIFTAGLTHLAMASEPQPAPVAVTDCTTVTDVDTITITVLPASTPGGALTTLSPSISTISFLPTSAVTAGPVAGSPSCSAATGTQGSPSSYTIYNWCQCGDIASDMSTSSSDGTVYSVCNGATVGSSPATTTVTILTASTSAATTNGTSTGASSHHSGSSSSPTASPTDGGNNNNAAAGHGSSMTLLGLAAGLGAAWGML